MLAQILARIIRLDCGGKLWFSSAASIYIGVYSGTRPEFPYLYTYFGWNQSIRVFARLVHRMVYRKEGKLRVAYLCRCAW